MGRNQQLGVEALDSLEAFDQPPAIAHETVVAADFGLAPAEAPLEAVDVPHLARSAQAIAAENNAPAIDLHRVAERTLGVAGCGENANRRGAEAEFLTIGERVAHGERFRPGQVIGPKRPIHAPEGSFIVPVGGGIREEFAFQRGDPDAGALHDKAVRATGLVTVMVSEDNPLHLSDAQLRQSLSNARSQSTSSAFSPSRTMPT